MQLTLPEILSVYERPLKEALGTTNYYFILKEFDRLMHTDLQCQKAGHHFEDL